MEPIWIIGTLFGILQTIIFFLLKFMFDRDKENENKIDSLEREVNLARAEFSEKILASMRAQDKKIEELHIIQIEKKLSANTKDIEWLKESRK